MPAIPFACTILHRQVFFSLQQLLNFLQVLELLSEDYGGHVELSKAYFKALTASLRKHFNGNGVISSMQQASDFFFLGTETIALGRAGMSSEFFSNQCNNSEWH